jgi:hypothetical protein
MSVSGQLLEVVRRYGSVYRVAKDSGIPQSVLQRFVAGDRGLSMQNIDKLAEFFDMHLTRPKRIAPRRRQK